MAKFYAHWRHRIGLEIVKMKQTMRRKEGDKHQAALFKQEIQDYIGKVELEEREKAFKNVYTTNHKR